MVALFKVRRPGSGVIIVGRYPYFWSALGSVHLVSGVAIAIADWLIPAVNKIVRINDQVMSLQLSHTLAVLAVFSVHPSPKLQGE